MLWSTSMEIPVGAPEPQAAQAFIDFVYDPKVQADIAECVNYVTPVQRREGDPRASATPRCAKSQLIFPSEDYTANCNFEPVLGGEQGQEVTEAFQRRSATSAATLDRGAPDGAGLRRSGGDAAPRRARAARPRVVPHVQLVMFPELHLPALPPRSSRTDRRPSPWRCRVR